MARIKLIPAKINLVTLSTFIDKINYISDNNIDLTISHKNLTLLDFVSNKDIKSDYFLIIDKIYILAKIVHINNINYIVYNAHKVNKNGDIIKSDIGIVSTNILYLSGEIQNTLNNLKNG